MLIASDIHVAFGGVCAVDRMSLEVGASELVGLTGPNGSGKSTFLNALCGVVQAGGQLRVDGRNIPLRRPTAIARAGLARVFQAPHCFVEGMTCLDNVLLACPDRANEGLVGALLTRHWMWRAEHRRCRDAANALELCGLAALAETSVELLPYGRLRMLELSRAIAMRPKVLLLDEPSAGLNDSETAELAEVLLELQRRGVAMLLVDHKIDFLNSVVTRLVVMELGQPIADGPPDLVWRDPQVVSAYLGSDFDDAER